MNKKKALILGISGQDGAFLAEFLVKQGYDVVGTSRDAQTTPFNNLQRLGLLDRVQLRSLSLLDFRSMVELLRSERPSEIYNLAGQTSVGLSFDQPIETLESVTTGTLTLLEAIRLSNLPVRLYNAGSGEVFGDTGDKPANEQSVFKPRSPYGIAKASAFWYVANYRESYNMHASTGILFNHESNFRPARFVTQKIIRAACDIHLKKTGRLKLGNIDIARDWGWAPEYVQAMWKMLQLDTPQDFVIATGKTSTLEQFIDCAFGYFGLRWQDWVDLDASFRRPSDIKCSSANPNKANHVLGWRAGLQMKDVVRMMIEAHLADLKIR